MKGQNTWSYQPYRPFLWEVGDIYICRVVPGETTLHFEWLPHEFGETKAYFRIRGTEEWTEAAVEGTECDIAGLVNGTDYEFYVEAGEKKSRIRLAKCGKSVGTVVNYLHPEDECYAFSGRYLCSPTLVLHPDGYLLAGMDVFEGNNSQNLELIFRSDDGGKTWHYQSELMPCFWGKLFLHKGELYMLSCSTEYGDLLIGKSTDGGKSFSAPVTLLRGANGKMGNSGVHKNPQNVMYHKGRIYETLEWGSWANQEYQHGAMVMSCDENADLLDPESWHFTPPKVFDPAFAPETAHLPKPNMTIEGTLAVTPEGELFNYMRFGDPDGNILAYKVNIEDPDAPLEYDHLVPFPANYSKFTIKRDPVTGKYLTIATRVYDKERLGTRNLLSLMVSDDLKEWKLVCDLLDYRQEDPQDVGFQYVDYEFDGDDLIWLCRTAINGAHNFHDANYSTFHRIDNFRELLK